MGFLGGGTDCVTLKGIPIGRTLIVQEAGGRVTDFYGNAGFIDGHHVVATNGWLHPFLLELVQKAMPLGM